MKILILAAMNKELVLLKELLEDAAKADINGVDVFTGKISGHEIILAKCGIGKVNAALNTIRLIEGCHPDLVINSGVAGGAGGLNIGDLLIADKAGYHDVWCGPGTVDGEADGFPKYFEAWKKTLETAAVALPEGSWHSGIIATGDKFISTADEIAAIHKVIPEAVACDMESAAIAHACALADVPFNIIRVVSDTPGEGENLSQYKNFFEEAPEKTFKAISALLAALN